MLEHGGGSGLAKSQNFYRTMAFYRARFRLKIWQPKICEYDGAIPVNAPVDPVFQGKQEAMYSWCYLSLQIV